MIIIYYEVGKEPKTRIIKRDLKEMQKLVDGPVENYQVNENICLVCNEEGYIRGLPMNRKVIDREGIIHQAICGNFFVCGAGAEDFISLKPDQIKKIMKYSDSGRYPAWVK